MSDRKFEYTIDADEMAASGVRTVDLVEVDGVRVVEVKAGQDARITELEAQLRTAEQFARDVAHKLGIEYAPPVAKGECAYLVALNGLRERAEKAEAEAGKLRKLLANCEQLLLDHGDPLRGDDWQMMQDIRAALAAEQADDEKGAKG